MSSSLFSFPWYHKLMLGTFFITKNKDLPQNVAGQNIINKDGLMERVASKMFRKFSDLGTFTPLDTHCRRPLNASGKHFPLHQITFKKIFLNVLSLKYMSIFKKVKHQKNQLLNWLSKYIKTFERGERKPLASFPSCSPARWFYTLPSPSTSRPVTGVAAHPYAHCL